MSDERFDKPLDSLVDLIRAFGKHSFEIKHDLDIQKASDHFEAWASHLIMGSKHPIRSDKDSYSLTERDWNGIVSAFEKYRKSEKEWVEKAVHEQKDILWMVVKQLGTMVQEDREAEKTIVKQLETLLKTSQDPESGDMKKVAEESVSLIVKTLKTRDEKKQKILTEMNNKVEDLEKEITVVKEEAAIDPLTKVFTRGAFDQRLSEALAVHKKTKRPASLFFFDVDDFKNINDNYGHQAGDEALQKIANTCVSVLKRENDVVARYGGDEFAAIMNDASLEDALKAGETIVKAIAALEFDNPDIKCSVSVGLAEVQYGDDVEAWLNRADKGVYLAKEAGKNNLKYNSGN